PQVRQVDLVETRQVALPPAQERPGGRRQPLQEGGRRDADFVDEARVAEGFRPQLVDAADGTAVGGEDSAADQQLQAHGGFSRGLACASTSRLEHLGGAYAKGPVLGGPNDERQARTGKPTEGPPRRLCLPLYWMP